MDRAQRLALLLLLAALTGCSVFNRPDRGRIAAPDAGADAGDADANADADDATDADDAPDGPVPEEICDNDLDEDGDTFVDCVDPDCASDPQCCNAVNATVAHTETWLNWQSRWNAWPESDWWPDVDPDTTRFRFEGWPDDQRRAILYESCVPLALGTTLATDVQFDAPVSSCIPGSDCEEYLALVFTASSSMGTGAHLLYDLAVRIYPSGDIQVLRGETELGRTTLSTSANTEVTIQITPATNDRGRAALFATVRTKPWGERAYTKITEGAEVLDQARALLDAGGCSAIPGLFFAVEGRGNAVRLGGVEIKTGGCANPSIFEVPSTDTATLDAATVTGDPGTLPVWVRGEIGAPALVCSASGAESVVWDLFYEATNARPSTGELRPLRYSIGQSRVDEDDWDDLQGWETGDAPKAGLPVPTCITEPCPASQSRNEPSALAHLNGDFSIYRFDMAYAYEIVPAIGASDPNVCGIGIDRIVDPDLNVAMAEPETTVEPNAVRERDAPDRPSPCTSLRDPSLVFAGLDGSDRGYWLFFTCANRQDRRIMATYLAGDGRLPAQVEHQQWLDVIGAAAGELGSYRELGAHGGEALRVVSDGVPPVITLLLWFVGESRDGPTIGLARSTVVALSDAASDVEAATTEAMETIDEYTANPVLTLRSPLLAGCPSCSIASFAVARRTDEAAVVRFLVAQRMQNRDDGTVFVPLEQTWSFP